jgi:hypothetical protein
MTDTSRIDDRAEALILALVEEGFFRIDEAGRIWRLLEKQGRRVYPVHPPRRAEYPATNGYLRIRVSVNGIRIRVSAHRVVYRYFKGDIPAGCVIDHENEVRDDNSPGNLFARTQKENVNRTFRARIASR